MLRFHGGSIALAAVAIGFLRPLRFLLGTLTAVTRMPQNLFSWMEQLGVEGSSWKAARGGDGESRRFCKILEGVIKVKIFE